MSKLLFDEQPLVVDVSLAKLIGLNESIILQQIHYWLEINKKTKRNFKDGFYWTYNSFENWKNENFPFWSIDTIKRTFTKLEKEGFIISNSFNKKKFDRTKWYRINYEKLESLKQENEEKTLEKPVNSDSGILHLSGDAKCTDGEMQNAPMEDSKMHRPIPEITSEISTENIKSCQVMSDIKEKPKEKEQTDRQDKTKKSKIIDLKEIEKDQKNYKTLIKENIGYDYLNTNIDKELADDFINVMVEYLVDCKSEKIIINKNEYALASVQSRLLKLNQNHFQHAIIQFMKIEENIKFKNKYILSCLFNSYTETKAWETNLISQDFGAESHFKKINV